MTTKKICVLLCFQSFLCAKHFFKQRLFYSRSFQKYSRTSVENSRTFQGYPTIFQFSRTFQAHDAFSRNQINLAITALENVATIYKDSVGTSLCMHFSCLCCWRQLQRYKIREWETKEQVGGRFVPVSKGFSKGGSNLYLGSFSETFTVTKIIVILKLLESWY